MIKNWVKNNKLNSIVILAYVATGFYSFDVLQKAISNTLMYLVEMIEILPAVFILTGLINAWVPPKMIIKNFGDNSGFRGKLISMIIGSLSAGPIYAAFPLAQSLLEKGASIGNIIIIISSWAVIKIPMLIVETRFLGLSFALTRYILTIPGIILLSIISERILGNDYANLKIEKNINSDKIDLIIEVLPGLNCGTCGYNSCSEYAKAIFKKESSINNCKPGGEDTLVKLRTLNNMTSV